MPAPENTPRITTCLSSEAVGRTRPAAASTTAPPPKRTTTVAAATNQVLMPGACALRCRPSAFITGKLKPHNAHVHTRAHNARSTDGLREPLTESVTVTTCHSFGFGDLIDGHAPRRGPAKPSATLCGERLRATWSARLREGGSGPCIGRASAASRLPARTSIYVGRPTWIGSHARARDPSAALARG